MKKIILALSFIMVICGSMSYASAYIVTTNLRLAYEVGDSLAWKIAEHQFQNNSHYDDLSHSLVSEIENNTNEYYMKYIMTSILYNPNETVVVGNAYVNSTNNPSPTNVTHWNIMEENSSFKFNKSSEVLMLSYTFPKDVGYNDLGNDTDIKNGLFIQLQQLFTIKNMLLNDDSVIEYSDDDLQVNTTETTLDFNYSEIYVIQSDLNNTAPMLLDCVYTFNITIFSELNSNKAIKNRTMVLNMNLIAKYSGQVMGGMIIQQRQTLQLIYDSTSPSSVPLAMLPYYYIILIVIAVSIPVVIYIAYARSKACAVDPQHWYCPRSSNNPEQ